MNSAKANRKKPREIKYFKKYTKPPKREITYLDSGKILYKGKDVTPAPIKDPAYLTYPSPALYILQPVYAPPLPPPTPLTDVDPSEWLNYTPPTENYPNGRRTPSPSSLSMDSGYEPLRTDIDLEELTRDEQAELAPVKAKKEEEFKVKILDDDVFIKAEYKKIEEGKFVLVLDETDTIFLLEISTPQLEASSTEKGKEEPKLPSPLHKGKKKKDKKQQSRKATAQHETQTIPPLMIDEQVETYNLPKKDFSVNVTDYQIYDGLKEAAQLDARNAQEIVKCLFQKLYDMLMDPKGHFKNDLSYINFHLQIMDAELKKLPYDKQIKTVCQFIRDYEEDPDIEQLAKELENDYDGFIGEIRRVRDLLDPPKEPEEGEAVEEEPIVAVQNMELAPLPGYEPKVSYEDVREILKNVEFANYSLPKCLSPEEEFERILRSKAFKRALNDLENIFIYQKEYDKLYRSMKIECIPEQPDVESMYNLDLLWEFQDEGAKGKAVTCIKWCKECPDLLAIGYGRRGYENSLMPSERGLLLIWSSVLPRERPLSRLETKSSVISICFHPESFYILALGLSSGDIVLVEIYEEVLSVCSKVVLQETHSFGHVYALEWFLPQLEEFDDKPKKKSKKKPNSKQNEKKNYEVDDESENTGLLEDTYLVAGGRHGSLFTWKASFGLLISELVIKLPKMCGRVKGIQSNLPIHKTPMSVPSRPAVTCIEMHPKCKVHGKVEKETEELVLPETHNVTAALCYDLPHLYLAATDDGTVHQCYYRKMHYHQDFFRAHNGPVYCLSFNPFIDTIFLTCGGDWAIRIWCLGVGDPLITLKHDMESVETAHWSMHYPTIVASIKENDLCIWDLARRTSSPVTTFTNPNGHSFTSVSFSEDGLNVVTGDSGGNVCIYHLMDVPFVSKFPVQHLVNAIKKALVNKPEILNELEDLGDPFKTE